MSQELTKAQKRRLRDLAGLAYGRELAAASEALLGEFHRWNNKEIDVFELNEKIHEFHNGISRALYGRYVGMDPKFGVAHAIQSGVLKRVEIDDDIFALVSGMVEVLSSSAFK
jgi:hypothetical protein